MHAGLPASNSADFQCEPMCGSAGQPHSLSSPTNQSSTAGVANWTRVCAIISSAYRAVVEEPLGTIGDRWTTTMTRVWLFVGAVLAVVGMVYGWRSGLYERIFP